MSDPARHGAIAYSRRMRGIAIGRAVRLGIAGLAAAVILLPACGRLAGDPVVSTASDGTPATGTPAVPQPTADTSAADRRPTANLAVDPPGPLEDPLEFADMLVFNQRDLDAEMIEEIRALDGVEVVEVIGLSQVPVEGRALNVAAIDPATYRRFTPQGSAQTQEVWDRVAGGEIAIVPKLGRTVGDAKNLVQLGAAADSPIAHVGALAEQVSQVDAVVNRKWGEHLGMELDNALLISFGSTSPQSVRPAIEEIVGSDASVQILGPDLDTSVQQTAVVTGGSLSALIGTFNYRVIGGGRIAPDPAWVRANIVTREVPILGKVTCHKAMVPQLEGALLDIVAAGLADEIHPDEYAGCYYPRFIAGTTSLSNHSFGTAVDLNVPGNQRGTVGEMHRGVVTIFKRWGFAWGGDWRWTDPMHFEMNKVVVPG